MMVFRSPPWLVILLSFIVAYLLTAVPLPDWALAFRPEWVTMVLIYWCLALPQRVGIGSGWIAGLILDVMNGTLLGQHALALAAVAYVTQKLHQRIRMFPLWQQALSILVLIAMSQMLNLWVKGIIGAPPHTWSYWLASVTSMLLWPWVFILLRDIRRRFHVV